MPTTFQQIYGAETAIVWAGLATLVTNTPTYSPEISNATDLFDEVILKLKCGGTAASTSWVDVRIAASTDGGAEFSSTIAPYLVLPTVDFSAVPVVAHFRFIPPQRWKVIVTNRSAANFTSGTLTYQGIKYQGVAS